MFFNCLVQVCRTWNSFGQLELATKVGLRPFKTMSINLERIGLQKRFPGHRVLIVGQGLAGSLLSVELLRLGQEVQVVDAADPGAASRVAPGILNPLAGKKLHPSWEVREQLPKGRQVYERLGDFLGKRFFHEMPILRIIKDAPQAKLFAQRHTEDQARVYIGETFSPEALDRRIKAPFGSFSSVGSGYLDTADFVLSVADWLRAEGRLREDDFNHHGLESWQGRWVYKGESFDQVVFCEGWRGKDNPYLKALPFNPAKGEMLDLQSVEAEGLPQAIMNRGKWLLPLGNGRFRAGANYSWDPLDTLPTPAARREILAMLAEFLDIPFEVTGQRAGVRPILRDYRPALGVLPPFSGLFVFNGLGSKGVLSAPWLAEQLAAHLVEAAPLPPEARVERFFPKNQPKRPET
jgi:glycine/D-amino acid oxidase-like deaminating enzyme